MLATRGELMNTVVMLFALAVSDPSFIADTATSLNNQGVQLYSQARYGEAEHVYRKVLDLPVESGTEAARVRAVTAGNLGTLLRVTGRYAEACRMLLESLTEMEGNSASAPVEVLRTLENLASSYQAMGDLTSAETYARKAVMYAESHAEIRQRERVNVKLLVAGIHVDGRRFDQAEAELPTLLPEADEVQTMIVYNSLSAIALQRGVPADAERYARLVLERAARGLPKNHPLLAMVSNNLAQACRFQEKYLEAETYYREAIAQWETSIGPSHPDLAKGLSNLAAFYHERGRDAGAEALYLRAETIFDKALGPDSVLALVARNERADALRGQHRYAEAERVGSQSLAALEKRLPVEDPRVLRALGNRARLLSETRRREEATRVLDRLRRVTAAGFR